MLTFYFYSENLYCMNMFELIIGKLITHSRLFPIKSWHRSWSMQQRRKSKTRLWIMNTLYKNWYIHLLNKQCVGTSQTVCLWLISAWCDMFACKCLGMSGWVVKRESDRSVGGIGQIVYVQIDEWMSKRVHDYVSVWQGERLTKWERKRLRGFIIECAC